MKSTDHALHSGFDQILGTVPLFLGVSRSLLQKRQFTQGQQKSSSRLLGALAFWSD